MAALNISMSVPLGDAGTVSLAIDVADVDALTPAQRQAVADTGREYWEFAAQALTGPAPGLVPAGPPEAEVYDPSSAVLAGVTGTRARGKL